MSLRSAIDYGVHRLLKDQDEDADYSDDDTNYKHGKVGFVAGSDGINFFWIIRVILNIDLLSGLIGATLICFCVLP